MIVALAIPAALAVAIVSGGWYFRGILGAWAAAGVCCAAFYALFLSAEATANAPYATQGDQFGFLGWYDLSRVGAIASIVAAVVLTAVVVGSQQATMTTEANCDSLPL